MAPTSPRKKSRVARGSFAKTPKNAPVWKTEVGKLALEGGLPKTADSALRLFNKNSEPVFLRHLKDWVKRYNNAKNDSERAYCLSRVFESVLKSHGILRYGGEVVTKTSLKKLKEAIKR